MTFVHEFFDDEIVVEDDVKNVKEGDCVAVCPAFYCGHCESCQKGELARSEHLHVAGAYVPGAYAEYIKLPEENVIPIPDNVDYDTAAMVEPSAVVVHGFYRTNIH